MPDYALERDTAINVHGQYWGSVLQALLATLPNRDQYEQLVKAHSDALSNIGVKYMAFFPRGYATREDGVHPAQRAMDYAVHVVKMALIKEYEDETVSGIKGSLKLRMAKNCISRQEGAQEA